MPAFAILFHEMPSAAQRPSHWDLMLARDGTLATWAVDATPDSENGQAALQLGDHRVAYLEFEGPLSDNRGNVTQWDRGEYERLSWSDDRVEVRLIGNRLTGIAKIWRLENKSWRFAFVPE